MRHLSTFGRQHNLVLAIAAAVALLGGEAASAQEDNFSAPAPLQFPTLPTPEATGMLPMSAVRNGLELAGSAELCKILTREADPDAVIPPGFTFAQCDPAIAAKVNSRSGSIRWASGARPSECGGNCVGRPFHGQTWSLDRPNRRFVSVLGRLTFTALNVGPTPFDRDVTFPVEVRLQCSIEGGGTRGEVRVSAVVSQPFADEPGFVESLADFFLGPLSLSRSIEDGIRAAVGGGGTMPGPSLGPCTSFGAILDPESRTFDSFAWNVPRPLPQKVLTDTRLGSTATIVFDSIVRHRTLETSPPPAGPLQFLVYVNGNPALIPRIGTLDLPPGGRHDQTYCRTVDVAGAEALQILFVDNLGGAVWSQFPRGADFGNGPPRTMTTGRQYFESPRPPFEGVPQPPGGNKPQAFVAREFEVRYHIDFQPLLVAPPQVPKGGLHGEVHVPVDGGVATTDTAPPPPPCIRI
jgi:hypothetical protein